MSENSIKFSLSNSEQRDSWLNSSHQTLDADKSLEYCQQFLVMYIVVQFSVVMLCKRLGKISDILHLNNENNQLER